jgi:3-dehydroquinate dehydratase-2
LERFLVQVLHGPNLDRLGRREPQFYGRETMAEIDLSLQRLGGELGLRVQCRQSAHEGVLIDCIHAAADAGAAAFLINPGGLGHSSVSLRDAFLSVGLPMVEVHCSNVAAREPFRRRSLLSDIAIGVIGGFGPESYRLGLRALATHLAAAGA